MSSAIEARGLSVTLGDFHALDDVSFSVDSGSMCAVLGPNGGGKTTLLKCLLGLIQPVAGEVRLLGEVPTRVKPQRIGYVPQLKTLDRSFPALAVELVLSGIRRRWSWGLHESDRKLAAEALRLAGAEHLALRSVSWLSGGELQRVYLARALARRPDLVLLDEPASGVDMAGEADLLHVLEDYRRSSGATVLMVTHDWGTAWHHADSVLVLNRRVLAFGPPAIALTDDSLREAFGHHGHAHAMGWEAHGG